MLNTYKRYRLRIVNVIYWFLFSYMLAALIWWFISLQRQSKEMATYELFQVHTTLDSAVSPLQFNNQVNQVYLRQQRRSFKYIGEGTSFMLVILVGALFIYRAVRRQIRLADQQQNFTMAVTHELKTPIAVAKLNLETLQKRKLDEPQQQKLISSALSETIRLNDLCNNILLASQLEGGAPISTNEPVPLSTLTQQAVQDFTGRFPNRTLQSDIQPDVLLKGDPLMLQLALNNLIENAFKYSPKETPVHVRLHADKHKAILEVIDQGNGIPDAEKSMIFRKFYRVGNESLRKTKGTGLGLYLSRRIVRKHKGDITVINNMPKGSIFVLTFHTLS